jgi:phage baseplate assembly protein gpV
MNLKSKNSISFKSDKDLVIDVGGEEKEKVAKDITTESTGGAVNEKSAKEFVIEGGTEVRIKAGTSVTLEAGTTLEIKANASLKIQSAGVLQLSGSQIMLG